jgi:hypothetical protein
MENWFKMFLKLTAHRYIISYISYIITEIWIIIRNRVGTGWIGFERIVIIF